MVEQNIQKHRDERIVKLELFGVETKVSFRREEIKMLP